MFAAQNQWLATARTSVRIMLREAGD